MALTVLLFIVVSVCKCQSDILIEERDGKVEWFWRNFCSSLISDRSLIISEGDEWSHVIKNVQNSVLFNHIASKETFNKIEKFQTYFISLQTIEKYEQFLNNIYITTAWDSRAKYVVFITSKGLSVEDVFEKSWKYYLYNLNVIVQTDDSDLEMYTYFPFSNKSCGRNFKAMKIDVKEMFPEKIGNDVYGCELRLMGLNIKPYVIDISAPKGDPRASGLEVTIIHTILKKMNFTERYVKNPFPHWGYLLPDGNFSMTLRSLHENEVDIVFGMMIGNETLVDYFDTLVQHIDTAAVWFVPSAVQIAQWKNLAVIFDRTVWLAIFAVLVLNGVSWWVLGRWREPQKNYQDLTLCYMGSFYILLQGSFVTPGTWKLRTVVLIWSVASLLLNTAHQCQLTGILTSPLYEHQISNLKELTESNLKYGFYPILKDLYSETSNKVHQTIFHNFLPCSLTTTCMNRTAFQRDFAVAKNRRQGAYLIPKTYTDPNGKPMLYMFKDSEFLVWVKYFVYKGFPFANKMDALLLLLQSNGLIAKWDADVTYSRKEDGDIGGLQALSLEHLQGAFFLLLFGYMFAVIAFVGEYYRFRYRKMKLTPRHEEELS